MSITHANKNILKFGVVGNPIAHSKSPEIHAGFAKQFTPEIHLTYERILSPLDGFQETVTHFFDNGGKGLNITVPFKEEAFALCGVLSARAKSAKAVNTLWKENGILHGDNTDGVGLVNAILGLGWYLHGKKVLIIGAGGATRGVILPLAEAGVSSVTVANRTFSRAETLVNDLSSYLTQNQLEMTLDAVTLADMSGRYDLVINATSASLGEDTLVLPKDLTFDFAYEMAYGKPSQFLTQASARGAKIAEGIGMLSGQASESFYIWHGVRPSIKKGFI